GRGGEGGAGRGRLGGRRGGWGGGARSVERARADDEWLAGGALRRLGRADGAGRAALPAAAPGAARARTGAGGRAGGRDARGGGVGGGLLVGERQRVLPGGGDPGARGALPGGESVVASRWVLAPGGEFGVVADVVAERVAGRAGVRMLPNGAGVLGRGLFAGA